MFPTTDRYTARMDIPPWLNMLQAVGSIATPIGVAILAFVLARRQGQNDQLLAIRIQLYQTLVPQLNTLMCYMTFIGRWATLSPEDIIKLKRRLDHEFYCALPLFSEDVGHRYRQFMDACFAEFQDWGKDATIRSGAYRRRSAWRGPGEWAPGWDEMFERSDNETILGAELTLIRNRYDQLVTALVRDLSLAKARTKYTTDLVSMNAHSPARQDIRGGPHRV